MSSTKRPDTISNLMRRRQATEEGGQQPVSDYDRLLSEYRELQKMFEEQQRLIGSLEQDVASDPLTGLANRRTFGVELERSLATAQRYGRRHGLIALEVDDFQSLSERLGVETGEAVLRHVASLIRQNIRPTDVAARTEGAEFCIILNELRAIENAEMRAEEIAFIIGGTPCVGEKNTVHFSVSIGHTVFGADDEVSEIMHKVYQSMHSGKGRTHM